MRLPHALAGFHSLAAVCQGKHAEGQTERTTQMEIPRVQQMPRLPSPYNLRDWAKVSHDYLNLALDPDKTGELLPTLRFSDAAPGRFTLPSYLGLQGAEAINCIAATVSGGLTGLDMTHFKGHDWTQLCQAFFSKEDGVYTNGVGERAGGSFWYELFPNILGYQLHALYPAGKGGNARIRQIAEQWYRACVAMGGTKDALPNFDHTAFRFATMTPTDNKTWVEPDAAAGIAWLEYLAWRQHPDPRFLTAADWCLRALERRPAEKNPLYEVLLPYGAFIAARMNAEMGRDYDVQKLVNWCFEPGDRTAARWGWGVISDRFGADDCYGLVGSVIDTNGYAFTMNTCEWAGALTPIARYDTRYARAIGRWILNLANAARLFYPDALPADHQDDRAWADRNDPNACIAYEGLRKQAMRFVMPEADQSAAQGEERTGSFEETRRWDDRYEALTEAADGGQNHLEHIWRLTLPAAASYNLLARARVGPGTEAGKAFRFSYARRLAGPYEAAFVVDSKEARVYYCGIEAGAGAFYLKAESADQGITHPGGGAAELLVDLVRVGSVAPDLSPYATGDAQGSGNPSNLCLYGASHVGILGAIIAPTDVERILQLNLLKTDTFHDRAYPSYLYYNPYDTPRTVHLAVGSEAKDLYDARGHRFLKRHVRNTVAITIPADSALVLVAAPAGGKVTLQKGKRLIDGVIVDYRCKPGKESPRY